MAIESESEVQCRRRLPVRRSKERVEERKREAWKKVFGLVRWYLVSTSTCSLARVCSAFINGSFFSTCQAFWRRREAHMRCLTQEFIMHALFSDNRPSVCCLLIASPVA